VVEVGAGAVVVACSAMTVVAEAESKCSHALGMNAKARIRATSKEKRVRRVAGLIVPPLSRLGRSTPA
jgi:hypothetical protein